MYKRLATSDNVVVVVNDSSEPVTQYVASGHLFMYLASPETHSTGPARGKPWMTILHVLTILTTTSTAA
jgi:hypothetical protein